MGFYTEDAKRLNITPIDAPAFFIECAQTEQALFEGLIELDFAEVYNEAGIMTLSEADVEAAKSASDKAVDDASKSIFQKFLGAIQKIFDKVSAALIDFFNGTKSLVAKKLDNPRAKHCQVKDIWFSDYKAVVTDLENVCKDSLSNIKVWPENADDSEYVSLIKEQSKSITESLSNILAAMPTTRQEAEDKERAKSFADALAEARNGLKELSSGNIGSTQYTRNLASIINAGEKGYKTIKPKELGGIDFTALTKELSVGGAGSNIKSIFELLKKPEEKNKEIDENHPRVKNAFTLCTTRVRLALFSSYTKGCLNSAKIARRNYTLISKYISGKVLNPDEEVSESAEYYGALSDLFCEQVFEF